MYQTKKKSDQGKGKRKVRKRGGTREEERGKQEKSVPDEERK